MALKTFVIVSGVNNLSDARYCAGMGVDLIGFALEEGQEGHVAPNDYKEITEWLEGVQYVGEFENASADQIKAALQNYPVQYIQVNQAAVLTDLQDLQPPLQAPVILKVVVSDHNPLSASLLAPYTDRVALFLIENETPHYHNALIERVKELAPKYPIVLGSGLTPNNVTSLIDHARIKGIALKGGNEIKPGFKNFDELADILEAIEIDDVEEGV